MKSKKGKQGGGEAYALVYSTDPVPAPRCPTCHKNPCSCPAQVKVGPLKPAFRIERKGRGGKTVTVVAKLPAHETFLKQLCAHLKKSIGTGGTYYLENGQGIIEVQGEWLDQVREKVLAYQT